MYLGEPIKGLLRQFVLFAVLLQVRDNARPYALELLQCCRHLNCETSIGNPLLSGQDEGWEVRVQEGNFRGER
jgi:hypothetical protein